MGLACAEIDEAEADDVIAALVRLAGADRDVWIMSGDRDFYQLVTRTVRVVNSHAAGVERELLHRAARSVAG